MPKGVEIINFPAVKIPRNANVSDVVATRAAISALPLRVPLTRGADAIKNVTGELLRGAQRGMDCFKPPKSNGDESQTFYTRTTDPREYLKDLITKIRSGGNIAKSDLQPGDCDGCPLIGKKCPIWFYGFRDPVVDAYGKTHGVSPNEAVKKIDSILKGQS